MPISQDDKLLENETLIRWDGTGDPAKLWTADSKVAKEWRSFGFPVTSWLTGGWYCEVPADRIAYKPVLTKRKNPQESAKAEKRSKIAKDSEAKSNALP